MGKVKPFKRSAISEKDTFRYSTPDLKVVANPMNTYVAPRMSATAERLAQLTGTFGRSAAGAYQEYDRGQEEQGGNAAKMGKERPEDASTTFLKAYDLQDGKSKAVAYAQELQGLLDESVDDTPEEFQAKAEKLTAQYINGRSDAFQLGFGPIAQMSRNKAYSTHQAEVTKQVNNKFLSSVSAGAVGDAGLAWTEANGDVTKYATNSRKALLYNARTGGAAHRIPERDLLKAQLVTLGEKAISEKNPDLLAGFYVKGADGKAITDDPALLELANQYKRKAEATQGADNFNKVFEQLSDKHVNPDGTVNWEKFSEDVMNRDTQKALGIDGKTAFQMRSQANAVMTAENTKRTKARDDNYRSVADKAFTLAYDGDMAEAIYTVRNSPLLDGLQQDKLIKALSGSSVSNPFMLNQAREAVISGDLQTAEGVYGIEGISMPDKRELVTMMDRIKKPENAYISTQLKNLKKYIPNPLGSEPPLYHQSVMELYTDLEQQIKTWEENGENVKEKLTPEFIQQRARLYMRSMDELMKSSMEALSANPSSVDQARDYSFHKYGQGFSGFVFDYFNKEGKTLGGMKPGTRNWNQIKEYLDDKRARKHLYKLYQQSK